ncbi:hypothetical protein C0Q70_01762 [Pomacea canaliculata]|uniref:CDP-diacylglycerol--glycerol-3-phosphate 3-phosphatidyltransferase n=1 Tax=Pomacea canaliculata TaxID=400727 RepID=A0A2T7Q0D2_POMCA|nr:hypothetical protein C0Q70_01762 [Pomacea canaliculata]
MPYPWRGSRMLILMGNVQTLVKRFLGTGTTSDASALEADIASSAENQVSNAFSSSTYQYFSWIGQHAPCFPICGDQVQVLTEPTQFFEVLKVKARKAKRRITLASLYLGTGPLEKELVSSIHEACKNAAIMKNSDFEVNILLDVTRGSRGKINSRTMLQGLIKEFPHLVSVSLYHTPDLRGLLRKIVPERFNETIGLTHLKVYLVDNSLIISGANLSENYFTNRQDRYILFSDCKRMADFFHELVKAVASFSFSLQPDDTLKLHKMCSVHPYKGDDMKFKLAARDRISDVLQRHMQTQQKLWQGNGDMKSPTNGSAGPHLPQVSGVQNGGNIADKNDTWVYPLVQMGPIGVLHDEQVTLQLLRESSKDDEILLASGYFNLTDHYMEVILQESLARYRLLMASPEVNGFYGAKGIAGYVPSAYVYIARQFFQEVQAYKQAQRIQLFEYFRDKWTFHVKGLWYYLPEQTMPSLTLIGSPNFGYRSVYRDLECQVAMVTDNQNLQKQLKEVEW